MLQFHVYFFSVCLFVCLSHAFHSTRLCRATQVLFCILKTIFDVIRNQIQLSARFANVLWVRLVFGIPVIISSNAVDWSSHPLISTISIAVFQKHKQTETKRLYDEREEHIRKQISRSEICYIFERKDLDGISLKWSLALSTSAAVSDFAPHGQRYTFFCCTFLFSVEIVFAITKSKFRFCWLHSTLSRLFVFFTDENNFRGKKKLCAAESKNSHKMDFFSLVCAVCALFVSFRLRALSAIEQTHCGSHFWLSSPIATHLLTRA